MNFKSHRFVVLDLVKRNGWKVGAELGVASGQLFSMLLRECPDLFLYGVDAMRVPERAEKVRNYARTYQDRVAFFEGSTHDVHVYVDDASLDFVFIDADHRYEAVKKDIANWTPKVRPGGMVLGHDYNRGAFPGVIQAVDEAFDGRVHQFEWHVWGVQL